MAGRGGITPARLTGQRENLVQTIAATSGLSQAGPPGVDKWGASLMLIVYICADALLILTDACQHHNTFGYPRSKRFSTALHHIAVRSPSGFARLSED